MKLNNDELVSAVLYCLWSRSNKCHAVILHRQVRRGLITPPGVWLCGVPEGDKLHEARQDHFHL